MPSVLGGTHSAMTGSWSFFHQFRAVCVALAIIVFVSLAAPSVVAKDVPGGPDTPVSSDTIEPSAGATDSPAAGKSFKPIGESPVTTDSTAQTDTAAAEIGSQAKEKALVSHEQEEKDRMFVDATFIAVAIILCVLAFFLFMSLPKQPKKAGSDNQ